MTVDICDVWSGVDQTKIRSFCLNDGCVDTFELDSLIVSSVDFFCGFGDLFKNNLM